MYFLMPSFNRGLTELIMQIFLRGFLDFRPLAPRGVPE
jgi:hypothetical protein